MSDSHDKVKFAMKRTCVKEICTLNFDILQPASASCFKQRNASSTRPFRFGDSRLLMTFFSALFSASPPPRVASKRLIIIYLGDHPFENYVIVMRHQTLEPLCMNYVHNYTVATSYIDKALVRFAKHICK